MYVIIRSAKSLAPESHSHRCRPARAKQELTRASSNHSRKATWTAFERRVYKNVTEIGIYFDRSPATLS